jgi:hypothetical protein
MTPRPGRVRVLGIALLLTAVFDVLALLVFLRGTPVFFAAFMFVGQGLFVIAVLLLLGAVLADLRAKQLL